MSTSANPAPTRKTAAAPAPVRPEATPDHSGKKPLGTARITAVDRGPIQNGRREREPYALPGVRFSFYRVGRDEPCTDELLDDICKLESCDYLRTVATDADGTAVVTDLDVGCYIAFLNIFPGRGKCFRITEECDARVEVDADLGYMLRFELVGEDCKAIVGCPFATVGQLVRFDAEVKGNWNPTYLKLIPSPGGWKESEDSQVFYQRITEAGLQKFKVGLWIGRFPTPGMTADQARDVVVQTEAVTNAVPPAPREVAGRLGIALSRTATTSTGDLAFWQALLQSTEQLSFNTYLRYMTTSSAAIRWMRRNFPQWQPRLLTCRSCAACRSPTPTPIGW